MLGGFERLQADIAAAGYSSALTVVPTAKTENGNASGMLRMTVIDRLAQDLDQKHNLLLGSFAQLVGTERGYSVLSIAVSRIALLKPLVKKYGDSIGARGVFTALTFPGLLDAFTDRLGEDLHAHGVTVTPTRIANLFIYRFARGMGYTVDHYRAALPTAVYAWLAADIDPRIMVLNFSALFNPDYNGVTPIPLADAPQLADMSIDFLRGLYAPDPLQYDFSIAKR